VDLERDIQDIASSVDIEPNEVGIGVDGADGGDGGGFDLAFEAKVADAAPRDDGDGHNADKGEEHDGAAREDGAPAGSPGFRFEAHQEEDDGRGGPDGGEVCPEEDGGAGGQGPFAQGDADADRPERRDERDGDGDAGDR